MKRELCIRCDKRPNENDDHWLPLCIPCEKEIVDMPHAEGQAEMQRLWDKFISGWEQNHQNESQVPK